MRPQILVFFAIIILFSLQTCGIYSFSGINIPPGIKTIQVKNFENLANGGPPNMAQNFTEGLRQYYQNNSSLAVVPTNGDYILEGNLVTYRLSPIATTGNDQSGGNRLTIEVEVKFTNTQDKTKDFKQKFSFYNDFPQNQSLSQVENELIDNIFKQLFLDIFNKTLSDW
ncbi:MAG: LPS assembly lipoprotein LptE [Microscillaceae bacterium]|nr:LPS assembly lipoprotein LptE [Microscillaceae bacterium]MDW8461501.1 LptE family protein [Cytophagales bacterium]